MLTRPLLRVVEREGEMSITGFVDRERTPEGVITVERDELVLGV